jgi:hypothetical protein
MQLGCAAKDGTIMAKSTLIDLTVAKHHETTMAVLVSETGEETKAVWLPLSKIEIEETGKTSTGTLKSGQAAMLPMIVVTLPEWLAIDKALI